MKIKGLIDYAGYTDCIKLENGTTRIILDHHCGGRILEYSWKGKNVICLDSKQDRWVYKPGCKEIDPYGGRFDIGPEMVIPRHPGLWLGKWKGEIINSRIGRLRSVEDKVTGVQLIREFKLDERDSHLRCRQIIRNISNKTRQWCHWSRTLATGGGICIVPLNPDSRFPRGYITYGPGPVLNYEPQGHPNVKIRHGFLEIRGTPPQPKFGLDSDAGWLSYLMPDNLLFVKRFPVYPDKIYNEMAAITVSIYYTDVLCELEPIGPGEKIKPRSSSSFTEDWWILSYQYPRSGEEIDLKALNKFVSHRLSK